jgi:hypothetical protein
MKKIIPYILVLIIGILLGHLWSIEHFSDTTKMIQTDTIVRLDTIIVEKPVVVERTIKDSLLVEVHDTIRIHDTLYLALPRETKIYKGEDYLAEVSGYNPSLDRIEVYPKTKVVTESITHMNRNSLGLGLDMSYVGTTSIPIYLEYSYLLHKNVEFSAMLMYDLPSQKMGFGLGAKVSFGW